MPPDRCSSDGNSIGEAARHPIFCKHPGQHAEAARFDPVLESFPVLASGRKWGYKSYQSTALAQLQVSTQKLTA